MPCRPLILLIFSLLPIMQCSHDVSWKVIPAAYVYSITEWNDSLYFSTRAGSTGRLHPKDPDSVTPMGLPRFRPLRTLHFLPNGTLLAGSYEGGIYKVLADTLRLLPGMIRPAWSFCCDGEDRIWLAGRQGLFRQRDDTLIRFTNLREANDVAFFGGKLAVAHRHGISLYDTATGAEERTWCRDTVFWSLDRFDSLLVCGGVETCLLVRTDGQMRTISIGPSGTIPWGAAMDSSGTIFLASQHGLLRIPPDGEKAECIGYRGKCVKSVHVDRMGRLWVGRYF